MFEGVGARAGGRCDRAAACRTTRSSPTSRRRGDRACGGWGRAGTCSSRHGRQLLLDPYLSRLVDAQVRRHREAARAHEPARHRARSGSDFVDVVTSSHNHTDHLDAETLGPILEAGAQLLCPTVNKEFARERLGREPRRDDRARGDRDGGRLRDPLRAGRPHRPGAAVLGLRRARRARRRSTTRATRCWSTGSSARAWTSRCWPINGALGNMDAHAAARFAHEMHARVAVPCHYDMFAFNTADPADFTAACDRLGQPHHVFRLGEGLRLPTGPRAGRWSGARRARGAVCGRLPGRRAGRGAHGGAAGARRALARRHRPHRGPPLGPSRPSSPTTPRPTSPAPTRRRSARRVGARAAAHRRRVGGAGRGDDGRRTRGRGIRGGAVRVRGGGWGWTAPVTAHPGGAGAIGAEQLAGNVWEWVAEGRPTAGARARRLLPRPRVGRARVARPARRPRPRRPPHDRL